MNGMREEVERCFYIFSSRALLLGSSMQVQWKVRPHHPQQTNVTHEWHRWELVARKVSTSHDVYVTCEVNVSRSPEICPDRNSGVAQPLRAIEGLFINQVTQIPYTYRTILWGAVTSGTSVCARIASVHWAQNTLRKSWVSFRDEYNVK